MSNKWESSDTSILTIDNNGKLTQLKHGKVTVINTKIDSNGKTYSDSIKIYSVLYQDPKA